jgi:hypothetical protein
MIRSNLSLILEKVNSMNIVDTQEGHDQKGITYVKKYRKDRFIKEPVQNEL